MLPKSSLTLCNVIVERRVFTHFRCAFHEWHVSSQDTCEAALPLKSRFCLTFSWEMCYYESGRYYLNRIAHFHTSSLHPCCGARGAAFINTSHLNAIHRHQRESCLTKPVDMNSLADFFQPHVIWMLISFLSLLKSCTHRLMSTALEAVHFFLRAQGVAVTTH